MAKTVKLAKGKEFSFPTSAGGQPTKYPWDEWFSGDLLLLERSDVDAEGNLTGAKRDFEVERDAMPAKLKLAARKRYKIVQISKRDVDGKPIDHDGLIIKARDMTDDEKVAEDIQRAEDKAAKEAAKSKASTNGATHVQTTEPANA